MIRSIVFPRVLGKSLDDLQPALELFRALGFQPGNEWHEHGGHGSPEMLAPNGGIEFIAAHGGPPVDATVEVADADGAYEIVRKLMPTLSRPTLSAKAAEEDGAPGRMRFHLPPCRQRRATRIGHPRRRRMGHLWFIMRHLSPR